jgi:radical SAM superfamily enzyme YgiQ (UPF0313 family)
MTPTTPLLDEKVRSTFNGNVDILAGRGCPFKCTFCFTSISGQKWRGKSIEQLGREIKNIVDTYNPNRIYFRDELFFSDHQRILDLIDLYHENNYKFIWRATIRSTDIRDGYVNTDLLNKLAEAGCQTLKFGFESASDRVLKSIKKGIKVKNIQNVVDIFNKSGNKIQLNGSFMVGFPGESYREMCDTVSMATKMQKDVPNSRVIGPQYYRVYPGGELYENVKRDWNYAVPESFEAWRDRYKDSRNKLGFVDSGIKYPWIQDKSHQLASNADLFVEFAYANGFRFVDNYKKVLLNILRPIVLLRVRYDFYHFLVDIKLASAIINFSIWETLDNSSIYTFIKETSLYKTLKTTSLFRRVVKIFVN